MSYGTNWRVVRISAEEAEMRRQAHPAVIMAARVEQVRAARAAQQGAPTSARHIPGFTPRSHKNFKRG